MSKEKLLLVGGGAGDVLYLIVEHCPKKAFFLHVMDIRSRRCVLELA